LTYPHLTIMSHQSGYAIVDVDDDGADNGQGLEFKSERKVHGA
jgi:hypothetical protein